MDFYEKLKRDLRKIPWGAVASVLSEEVHARSGAVGDTFVLLKEWGLLLTQNAVVSWSAQIAADEACDSPNLAGGRPHPCKNGAVTRCDVCNRRCCLAHCRVDYFAGAICEVCIGEAKARARKHAPAPPPKDREAEIRAAMKTLKVKPGATWDEIKSSYKKLVVEYNADRPQSTRERARNTARLTRVNLAFDVLRRHFEEKKEAA